MSCTGRLLVDSALKYPRATESVSLTTNVRIRRAKLSKRSLGLGRILVTTSNILAANSSSKARF
jgi:hypothetical protein